MEENEINSCDLTGVHNDASDPSEGDSPVFAIEAFYPVFISSWKVETGMCSICRNLVEGPCIACQTEGDITKECYLWWGKCGHVFHEHCISRWTVSRKVCPLDNQPWQQNKLWDDKKHKKGIRDKTLRVRETDEEKWPTED